MTPLPVVARELAEQARRKGIYRLRAGAAVVALGVMVWLVIVSSANLPAAAQGQGIFTVLVSLAFLFCLFVGVRATSDCLSEEKREGTLGLLFLTDLKGHSVVMGKVAAGSFAALSALLGIVPVLFLAVLLGGVTFPQVAIGGVVLLNTMFLSLAAGAFVSALSQNERRAMIAAFVLVLALVFAPFGVSLILEGWSNPRFPYEIVWPSPIFTYIFVIERPFPNPFKHLVLPSLLVQHLTAWFLLVMAAFVLRRSLTAVPKARFEKIRAFAENHRYGTASVRKRYRARLLDRNAFLWLAAREKVKPRYAWAIIGTIAIGWSMTYFSFPRMAFDLPVSLLFMLLAHFVFKLWAASEVCSRLIEDRRSGALELLLSTPLSVKQVTQGQSLALRHIFFWPIAALMLFEIFLLMGGLNNLGQEVTRQEMLAFFGAAISTFLLDLWALKWVAMWHSLFATSIGRILVGTLFRILLLPWLLFGLFAVPIGLWDQLHHSRLAELDFLFLWWGLSIGIALLLGWSSRTSFLRHFRAAAAQRFDAATKATGSLDVWLSDLIHRFRFTTRMVSFVPLPFRRHWIITGITATILLVAGSALLRQWYWKAGAERRIAAIKAQGYPVTGADFARFHPPASSAENLAEALRLAGPATLGNFRFRPQSAPGIGPFNTSRARADLAKNGAQLAALLSATNFSRYYTPLQDTFANQWGIGSLHGYSRLGLLEIGLALQERDIPRALAGLDALLHVAKLLRAEPDDNSQVACIWYVHAVCEGLEMLLSQAELSHGQARHFTGQLDALQDAGSLTKMLALLRAETLVLFREGVDDPFMQPQFFAIINSIVNTAGSMDKMLVEYLNIMQSAMRIADLPLEQRHGAAQKLDDQQGMPLHRIFGAMAPFQNGLGVAPLFTQDLEIQMRAEILKIALAVAQYRQAKGAFPKKLEDLVPNFLPELPRDPLTGSTFEYLAGEEVTIFSNGGEAPPSPYYPQQLGSGQIQFRVKSPAAPPPAFPPPSETE